MRGGGVYRVAGLPYTDTPTREGTHSALPAGCSRCAAHIDACQRSGQARGCIPRPEIGTWCVWVFCLYGRESIFLFSHTNEFCGKRKVAHERPVAWPGLRRGRRVYE